MAGNCDSLTLATTLLRDRLTGNYASDNAENDAIHDPEPTLLGLEEESAKLSKLLEQTATAGESNSVLVCGPRGAGKTTLLRHVLTRLRAKLGNAKMLEVHLHGLTLTDDRLTLKEIARQLKLDNVMDDGRVRGSFAETLKFFLDSISVGDAKKSTPILFLLEEFDEFTSHPGQALLYNLFDISQTRTAPVCVVGVTSRLDVVELLEKRVKSRFSHRQIHVFAQHDFASYSESAIKLLSLPRAPKRFHDQNFAKKWNTHVAEAVKTKEVVDILRRLYATQKEYGYLFRFLFVVVSQISSRSPTLSSSNFVAAASILHLDSKTALLSGVSVLEFCLLVSMQRLADIYGPDEPVNFAMMYQEYKKFLEQHSMMQQTVASQSIVVKAFERLLSLELIRWADGGSRGGLTLKEFRPVQLLVDRRRLLEAAKTEKLPTAVEKWIETAAHA